MFLHGGELVNTVQRRITLHAADVSFVNIEMTCRLLRVQRKALRGGATRGGGGATWCLHHCPSTGQGCRRTPGDHCHTGARCVTLQTTNRQEERDTSSVNNMFTTCLLDTNKPEGVQTQQEGGNTGVCSGSDPETTHRSPRISSQSPGWRFHLTQWNKIHMWFNIWSVYTMNGVWTVPPEKLYTLQCSIIIMWYDF